MKNLSAVAQRILVGGFFGMIALLLLLFSSNLVFSIFASLIFLVVIFEYAAICSKKQISLLFIALLIFCGMRIYEFSSKICCDLEASYNWIFQQIFLAFVLLLLASFFRKGTFRFAFLFLLGCAWLAIPFLSFIGIIFLPDSKKLILFLVLVVIINDTAAYFAGKTFGKKKIAPRISPNKTYLGSIAGLLDGIIAGFLLNLWLQLFSNLEAIIFSAILIVTAQAGDLFESKFKRAFDIKDSGKILAAHGGMLDRMDALLFCFPVYLSLLYFRLFILN